MLSYFGDWHGFCDVSIDEAYRMIKRAGFDATLIWWDVEDWADFRTLPERARKAGLHVENMHASFDNANHLWEDSAAGQAAFEYYMMCLDDCGVYEIPTVVMHTGRGRDPLPPGSEPGMERFARLIDRAEELGVGIALENQGCPDKTLRAMELLERFGSPNLGMCYDSGHGNILTNLGRGREMLARFGHRLKALHLHDNDGSGDQHRLPGDGTIDWPAVMRQIRQAGYRGATTLELGNAYKQLAPEEFLDRAYQCALELEALRRA